MIDIEFREVKCKKCSDHAGYAILKGTRYALHCKGCGAFIKWADASQTVVINARKGWLNSQEGRKI